MTSDEDVWPKADLEYLHVCPICASPERQLLFDDLEDWTFRAAPGKWSLWNCSTCSTAYLDPRPNQASIGRAYKVYYTHGPADSGGPSSSLRQLARRIRNRARWAYYGAKFGQTVPIADRVAGAVFGRISKLTSVADLALRDLSPPKSREDRVLDIGCGSGEFLQDATALGYKAIGLDPDDAAVHTARAAGLDARNGGFPDIGFPDGYFSNVTLSHVFEHLHDPVQALGEMLRVLEPGGRLWMAMPNRDARGLEIFGKHWRGLEPPRHLSLVTPATLDDVLRRASFKNIMFLPQPPVGTFIAESSLAQQAGFLPNDPVAIKRIRGDHSARLAATLDEQAEVDPKRAEFLVVTAQKAATIDCRN